MRTPEFKTTKSSLAFTDYLIIGLRTHWQTHNEKAGLNHELIDEFCITHLKPGYNNLIVYDEPVIYGGSGIFEAILGIAQLGRRTLVVFNNSLVAIASSDFGDLVDGGFLEIEQNEIDKTDYGYTESSEDVSIQFIVSAPPTIVSLTRARSDTKITCVDIANYGVKYLETIWENIDKKEKDKIDTQAEIGVNINDCCVASGLMALFMQQYYKVCRTNKLGSVSLTYAGQAMKAYRKNFYAGEIKPHRNEEVAFLEESCYTGGRGEARFTGHYHGKVYLLDIQSLYPSLGLEWEFPCELAHQEKAPALSTVTSWLEDHIVFAHVQVESKDGLYPKRTGQATVYPVGRFNTYLCGEELRECIGRGEATHVYFAAAYHKSRCLEKYSRYMLDTRSVYKASKAKLSEFIAKYVTNGLWGKFAQLGNRWVKVEGVIHDMEYGGFVFIDQASQTEHQYRVIRGQTYRLERAYWQDNTFIPISAYANSLSRWILWRYMQFAGLSNILYCAIDGLIVTERGYKNLFPFIGDGLTQPGKFKTCESGESCYIYKYGVYTIGGKTAYMGMPRDNTKRTIGFWNSREDLIGNSFDIAESKLIVKAYRSPVDCRLHLGEEDIGDGAFISPPYLEEPPVSWPEYNRQKKQASLPFVSFLE